MGLPDHRVNRAAHHATPGKFVHVKVLVLLRILFDVFQ